MARIRNKPNVIGNSTPAPNTTPLMWNHTSLEGVWDTRLTWILEQAELDRSNVDIQKAEKAYVDVSVFSDKVGVTRISDHSITSWLPFYA